MARMRISIVGKPPGKASGFTYLMLLAAVAVLAIVATAAGTVISRVMQTDREAELLFRGQAYRRAIQSYVDANAERKLPIHLGDLVQDPRSLNRRHLRALYRDPMDRTGEGWRILRTPEGGIYGIASRSREAPNRKANLPTGFEQFAAAETYAQWVFEVAIPAPAGPSPANAIPGSTGREPTRGGRVTVQR